MVSSKREPQRGATEDVGVEGLLSLFLPAGSCPSSRARARGDGAWASGATGTGGRARTRRVRPRAGGSWPARRQRRCWPRRRFRCPRNQPVGRRPRTCRRKLNSEMLLCRGQPAVIEETFQIFALVARVADGLRDRRLVEHTIGAPGHTTGRGPRRWAWTSPAGHRASSRPLPL